MRISDWSSDVCSSDLREPIAVEDLKAMTRLAVRLFRHRKAEVPALEEDAQVDVAVQHQAHAAEGGHLVEAADLLVHRAVVSGQHHDGAERRHLFHQLLPRAVQAADRKSTRLNSSH